MNQKQLIERWKEGKPGKASALTTDGILLFSYGLPIGKRQKNGKLIVYDYRGQVSQTTSMHVGLAVGVADYVRKPPKPKPWS